MAPEFAGIGGRCSTGAVACASSCSSAAAAPIVAARSRNFLIVAAALAQFLIVALDGGRPIASLGATPRLCTAGGCVSIGASRHSRLGVPVCHEHARSYLDMGKRGWPLEAESGDHVTCQWCCGVVVENDAVVEHEESVFLCDGCNTAWCHSCLGANVGAGYVQQVAGAPDDVQWRCLYCDDALWATLAAGTGAAAADDSRARVARRGGRTAAGAASVGTERDDVRVGNRVEANWEGGGVWYAGVVERAAHCEREGAVAAGAAATHFAIRFDDGDFEEDVPPTSSRARRRGW